MSTARAQELEACITSLQKATIKLTAESESTKTKLQQTSAANALWQFESDEGWLHFDQRVNDILESTHGKREARSHLSSSAWPTRLT
jgi:hypothetical protein